VPRHTHCFDEGRFRLTVPCKDRSADRFERLRRLRMVHNRLVLLTAACGLALSGGCQRSPPQVPPAQPPTIPVSRPVQREVTDYVDYTGRTDAVESVGVRARATGYIERVLFREGAEVKKGDVLFEIDPRPYQAQLDQAQAQVQLNEASLKLARATLARAQSVAKINPGAISKQMLDEDEAAVEEAQARIKASQAAVDIYRINLEFCKVTSPIAGRISRYYFTPGNLVNQDQTLLTTVVSVDPMYAYFDMDEPTLLRIQQAIDAGRIKMDQGHAELPVDLGRQGETGYPHRGTFNFLNNIVNPSTGTIAARGVFPNPLKPGGVRLLVPGMFVRIRLPIGGPHQGLLVIDRAVGSDQGLPFVYVVNKDNKIEYRRVATGPLEDDGLRVILMGLHPDDRVVTGGLQQVRPQMDVSPDEMPMPNLANAGGQEPAPTGTGPQPPPPGANLDQPKAPAKGNPQQQPLPSSGTPKS
jgi:multidrug efflux system membrane fusion protein